MFPRNRKVGHYPAMKSKGLRNVPWGQFVAVNFDMIQTCDINVKTTSLCSSWRVTSQVHQQHIWSTWSTVYIFSHTTTFKAAMDFVEIPGQARHLHSHCLGAVPWRPWTIALKSALTIRPRNGLFWGPQKTSGKKRFKPLLAVILRVTNKMAIPTPLALHSGEWQWLVIHIPRKKGKYMYIYIYSEKAWPKYSIWNSLSFQVKHWLNKRIALHSAHQKRIWTTYKFTTCTLTRQNSCSFPWKNMNLPHTNQLETFMGSTSSINMALLSYAGLWKVRFSPFIQVNVWFLLVHLKRKNNWKNMQKRITSSNITCWRVFRFF